MNDLIWVPDDDLQINKKLLTIPTPVWVLPRGRTVFGGSGGMGLMNVPDIGGKTGGCDSCPWAAGVAAALPGYVLARLGGRSAYEWATWGSGLPLAGRSSPCWISPGDSRRVGLGPSMSEIRPRAKCPILCKETLSCRFWSLSCRISSIIVCSRSETDSLKRERSFSNS